MSKLNNVPANTITGKDLDYLSDMIQWNYIAFKKTCNDIDLLNEQKFVELFGEASDLFEDKLNMILDIINNPGGETDE